MNKKTDDKGERGSNPFAELYAHLSAVAGGVGLISLLRDIVEWRGFIGDIIVWWRAYITPIAEFLFGWIARALDVEWPHAAYDYLTLGIIFALGIPRLRFWVSAQRQAGGFSVTDLLGEDENWTPWLTLMPIIAIIAWPVYLLYLLVLCFEYMEPKNRGRVMYLLLSPFLVALGFLVVNVVLAAANVA